MCSHENCLDEAILMSTKIYYFQYKKKKNTLNDPKPAAMGFFPWDPRTGLK